MGTKIVYNHEIHLPNVRHFQKKYYFLIASLLFEFEPNGHYEDRVEIHGFSSNESEYLCNILPFIEGGENCLTISEFDTSILPTMISILPQEEKELLSDHIILSSIDQSSNIKDVFNNLKEYIPTLTPDIASSFLNRDFTNFFSLQKSVFMDEYYPSEEDKGEILLRYGLKR